MKVLLSLTFILFYTNLFATGKVTICHVPENNPSAAHTIEISQNALRGHLNSQGRLHGQDYFGACRHQGFSGFYACNISMKQTHSSGTLTTHDYVTYSYDSFDGEGAVGKTLEAGENNYKSLWSERTAFSRKLTKASFNFSSELYGTDYSVDLCFDGRRFANSRDDFEISEITFFSDRRQAIDISYKIFCDVHNRNNGVANLTLVDLRRGFPIRFNKVPEFCVVRFNVEEEEVGKRRDWTRAFNKLTTIIESNIDEINND